jgi:hypothetical protein
MNNVNIYSELVNSLTHRSSGTFAINDINTSIINLSSGGGSFSIMCKDPVGSYYLGGNSRSSSEFSFSLSKKPNIIKRIFNKFLLGWTWEDE